MARGVLTAVVRGGAVVLGVVALTFVLLHLAPGDPVSRMLGPTATAAQMAAGRVALGLDRPLAGQFLEWTGHALRGDFGRSIVRGEPVGAMLARAWPATAALVVASLALTYLFGVIVGVWQATMRRRSLDAAATVVTLALNALPGYWLALVLIMVFTYRLRWLPAFGAEGIDADFLETGPRIVDLLRHATLPLVTLTMIGFGGTARFVRASMREVTGAPFLTVARSKGISGTRIVWRHQFRNALIPVITLLGLSLPALFSGTVFVEAVFAWPGVGQLMVQGVQTRDYPVVMAAATVSAILVVVGNIAAEALVRVVDPRARARASHG